jgi:hypothetical protein
MRRLFPVLLAACASSPETVDPELPEGRMIRSSDVRFLGTTESRVACKADADCPAGALCHPAMKACFEPYPSMRVLDVDVEDEMTIEKEGKPCELVPIYFGPDSTDLVPEALPWLKHNSRCLRGIRNKRIELTGYADAVGAAGYNLKLSKKRSEVVRNYLRNRGIRGRIDVVGRGEDDPVFTGTSERDYAYNRRVEIRVLDK